MLAIVNHKRFGYGIVVNNFELDGMMFCVVNFQDIGIKTIYVNNLKFINDEEEVTV